MDDARWAGSEGGMSKTTQLERLYSKRIFLVRKEGPDRFAFTDGGDECFEQGLTADEVCQLMTGLLTLIDAGVEPGHAMFCFTS